MEVSTSSAYGSFLSQVQLRQAQGEADRAAANASALRARAQAAERSALRARENARSLRVEADQAQQQAGQAQQNATSVESLQDANSDFAQLRQQISEVGDQPSPTPVVTQPVVNVEGQQTGTLVNTTA